MLVLYSSRFDKVFFSLFFVFCFGVFRIREYGAEQVDFQIIFRLLSWVLSSSYILRYLIKHKKLPIVFGNREVIFWLFFISCIISGLLSSLPIRSLLAVFSFICVFLVLKYLAVRYGIQEGSEVLCQSMAPLLVVSYIFYFLIPELGRHIYWLNDSLYVSPRMSGIFGTSNSMAMFSSMYSMLCFFNISNANQRKYIGLILLSIVSLVLTSGKTSMLAFAVSMFFFGRMTKLKLIIMLGGVFVFITAVLLIIHVPDFFFTALSRHGDPSEVFTLTGRTYIWPAVFDIALEQPFLGRGIAVSSTTIPTLKYIIGYTPAHAHNLFLQAFFALGIFGFITVIGLTFINFLKAPSNPLALPFSIWLIILSITESTYLSGNVNISFVVLCYSLLFASYTKRDSINFIASDVEKLPYDYATN